MRLTRHGSSIAFASIHSYLDPSSGAALATRELLELLAARGWDCRALTCGVLDYQNETPLEDVLATIERPAPRAGAALSRGGEAEVFDLELNGVRVTLMPTSHSRAERAPNPREGAMFLDLADAGARAIPARDPADVRRPPRLPRPDASRPGPRAPRSSFICTTSATTIDGGSKTSTRSSSLPSIRGGTIRAGLDWTGS